MLKGRILIVEDDSGARLGVRSYLESCGYEIAEAESCAAALATLKVEVPDLILLDHGLPDGTALDVLRGIKGDGIEVPVVVLTGHGSIELAVTAIKEGAEQFLTKPIELASLAVVVERTIEHQLNSRRVKAAQVRPSGADDLFVGASAAMRALARDARAAADRKAECA